MMDKRTRAALEESIQHWQENVNARTPDDAALGPSECALCREFNDTHCCVGCPVSAATDMDYCHGTPYSAADRAHDEWLTFPQDNVRAEKFREAAKAELAFLISLRPTEGGDA